MTLDADSELCQSDIITAPVPRFGTDAPCEAFGGTPMETSRSGWGGPRPGFGGHQPGSGRPRKIIAPTAPQLVDNTFRWYCVRTEFGADLIADIEIRRAGWTIFAPTIWKAETKPRRDINGVMRPGQPDRIIPMFPRYLFVQFNRADPSWREIRYLRGVERIFSTHPERPTPIPDTSIDAIRKLLAPNGCLYPPKHAIGPERFAKGSAVRVTFGPMTDWTGVCEMSDGQRVKVLLEMMGRTVPVMMAQSDVALVDA